jgi:hypothetical protein
VQLYWADFTRLAIEVANLNGSFRKVLFFKDIDKPSSLTLVYRLGYVVWTNWGAAARIERGGMDGTERTVLVSGNLGWPHSVSYDPTSRRVVWSDAKLDRVEACSIMDGSERKTLMKRGMGKPYAVAPHGDRMYWADWATDSLRELRFNEPFEVPSRVVANRTRAVDIALIKVRLSFPFFPKHLIEEAFSFVLLVFCKLTFSIVDTRVDEEMRNVTSSFLGRIVSEISCSSFCFQLKDSCIFCISSQHQNSLFSFSSQKLLLRVSVKAGISESTDCFSSPFETPGSPNIPCLPVSSSILR